MIAIRPEILHTTHMFCDELHIKVIAGKGGDGCVSFRREKFIAKGGPNGGDGGKGGNIIIAVNPNLNTLGHIAHTKVFKAHEGVHGKGKNMHGKNAEHLVIEVPQGTIILNNDKSKIIADLSQEDDELIIAQGGIGGHGNARFVSSTHQAPRFAEMGEPGEEKNVVLELKLVADVGIIGLPSAGKSTLISVISNAKPRIAAYHFTTLIPNLGVVNMKKFGGNQESTFVVADIPGLIEGASEGKGLGHKFLKHIARTALLVHVVDGTLENVGENYKVIQNELKKFDKKLAKEEQIIVLNKIDAINEDDLKAKINDLKKASRKTKIFPISAITGEGLKELMHTLIKEVHKIGKEEPKINKEKKQIPILKPHEDLVKFEIEKIVKKKDHKIFKINGKRIDQLIVMTDISNNEGLERIYHFMERMGIKRAVEKKGAEFGDIIKIKEKNIPYRK